jgi:hypothetical protein
MGKKLKLILLKKDKTLWRNNYYKQNESKLNSDKNNLNSKEDKAKHDVIKVIL